MGIALRCPYDDWLFVQYHFWSTRKAVAARVSGPRLTLTEVGRRFGGGSDLRHRIKRAVRLLGNVHLQGDAPQIHTAVGRTLLADVAEPLIVIDWSDLKADQSLHLSGTALHPELE